MFGVIVMLQNEFGVDQMPTWLYRIIMDIIKIWKFCPQNMIFLKQLSNTGSLFVNNAVFNLFLFHFVIL